MNQSANNKRIARNTLLLYFRMIITMLVALYTSRVVLNVLGIEDFGIYNVVGGVVAMFGFLNSAMSSATQRFLSFELGKKDFKRLQEVFSMSLNIHFLIAAIILILAETVGLWFVNTQMVIPPERMQAALWVFHFSILAFLVNIVSVPYNASIIAYEKMNVFAYISILEVSLKLLIVFMLQWFSFDKLKLYAVLTFSVAFIIRIVYGIYCKRKISSCRYSYVKDKALFHTLFSYAGWNLWGNLASVAMGQGTNILLNIFFGPTVNAARGIAYQVSSAVSQFVSNFQLAVDPQIVKSYASGELGYMHRLVFYSSKFSYFLLFCLSLPILLETEYILALWLKIVPEYTVLFTRLVICIVLVDSISGSLKAAAQASGRIKVYQSVVGGLLLLILPISYIFLKMGFSPEITMVVNIGISIVALLSRLAILKSLVSLSIRKFFTVVLIPIFLTTMISAIGPYAIYSNMEQGLARLILTVFISLIAAFLSIWWVGMNKWEREIISHKIKKFIHRRHAT